MLIQCHLTFLCVIVLKRRLSLAHYELLPGLPAPQIVLFQLFDFLILFIIALVENLSARPFYQVALFLLLLLLLFALLVHFCAHFTSLKGFLDTFFSLFARFLVSLIESLVLLNVVELSNSLDVLLAISLLQLPLVSILCKLGSLLLYIHVLAKIDTVWLCLNFFGNKIVPRLDGIEPFLVLIRVEIDLNAFLADILS